MRFCLSKETLEKLPGGDVDKHPVGRSAEITKEIAGLSPLLCIDDSLASFAAGFTLGYQMRIYDAAVEETIPIPEILASIGASYASLDIKNWDEQ